MFGFVEDPGSANFFVGLAATLADRGMALDLRADGVARSYLLMRNESPGLLPSDNDSRARVLGEAALLLVGTSENHDNPGFALVGDARRRGVPTVAIIDSPASVIERFGRPGRPIYVDYVVSAQPEVCDQVVRSGIALSGGRLVRHPYLDDLERRHVKMAREDRNKRREALFGSNVRSKKVVVFMSETSDGLRPPAFHRTESYTLQGWGNSDKRTHIVLQEVIDALRPLRDQVHFVMRLHPKDDKIEYAPFADFVDQVSQQEDARDVVYFADAVIGMTTNLIAEAAVMAVPVLSVVPQVAEERWLAQMTKPGVRVVNRRDDLPKALADLLFVAAPVRKRVDLDRPGLADTLADILFSMPANLSGSRGDSTSAEQN